MRLVVDASVLVAEALRVRGRVLVAHPALDLFIPVDAWDETTYEVRNRTMIVARYGVPGGRQAPDLLAEATAAIAPSLTVVPTADFADRLPEAEWRIPRDSSDAPAVALALKLDCGIWTNDRDFFGCGLAVWATEVFQRFLSR